MKVGKDEFANFLRLDAELRALATSYFEARVKAMPRPRLYAIKKVDFHDDGCTITYHSRHCSSCLDYEDPTEIYVSLEDLLEYGSDNEQDVTG